MDKWKALRDALAAELPGGPWFLGSDSGHASAHDDSGLALVETGRAEDFSVARLCEWGMARYIAACDPDTIRALLAAADEAERLREALQELVTLKGMHDAGRAADMVEYARRKPLAWAAARTALAAADEAPGTATGGRPARE